MRSLPQHFYQLRSLPQISLNLISTNSDRLLNIPQLAIAPLNPYSVLVKRK
ncbi:MAG: hypothetical protein KA717_11210 [Woronichinia naegeliana WA131]|uniref:Uncharacterized protein n=1 Tax=Woronichinia naegeliana WA131 TaxID=2824559 RepID=A0A977L206_9CYAN|nr:MAG: hypothetical protein KA717_11210 [Woronichinia naegeliana WA131]